jgi:hypothetical protein
VSLGGSEATYVAIAANLAAAIVYLFVGYRLYQRKVSPDARLASAQFSIWWGGLGVSAASTAFEALLYVGGALNFALALTFETVGILVDAVFLWALVDFLVYVYSGKYRLGWVSAYFASIYVVAVYYTFAETPYAVTIQGGVPTLALATTAPLALAIYAVIGIIGPELTGAALYLSLLRRTRDRMRRFRIAFVGTSILLWFGIDLVAGGSTTEAVLVRSLLEFIPPLMALIAYFPPAGLRTRLRLDPVEGGPDAPHEVAAHP